MWCFAVSLMTSPCVVRPRVYRGGVGQPPPGTLGTIDEEPGAVGFLRVLFPPHAPLRVGTSDQADAGGMNRN